MRLLQRIFGRNTKPQLSEFENAQASRLPLIESDYADILQICDSVVRPALYSHRRRKGSQLETQRTRGGFIIRCHTSETTDLRFPTSRIMWDELSAIGYVVRQLDGSGVLVTGFRSDRADSMTLEEIESRMSDLIDRKIEAEKNLPSA